MHFVADYGYQELVNKIHFPDHQHPMDLLMVVKVAVVKLAVVYFHLLWF